MGYEEYEFPVSPAQARLLVADRLHPGSAQYHVPVAFSVHGRFDPDAFGRALDALVARHESLRTVFRTRPGAEPVQVVAASARVGVHIEQSVAAGQVEARMRADAAAPFDIATGPLLRCTIYQVAGGSHRILLCAHHLVCDGWSLRVLLGELAEAYRAERDGTPHSFGELPIQYPDYAAWQADRLSRGEYADAIGHWTRQLRDAPATIPLPTDRPRAAVRSAAGGTVRFVMPAATQQRLAEVALARGGTPFMALFAAYAAFLGRLCGVEDLVVGVPVAGRDRPELHGMVGMLTNTLAVRVDLAGNPSFHALIDRVREQLAAGASYQDAPFDAVVDELAGVREPSQDPLVQVMFGYNDDTELALPLPGANAEPLDVALEVAIFDLMLYVQRSGTDLVAELSYRADLLDHPTAAGWAGNFETLLAGLLADPDAPAATVELIADDERRRVLDAGDRTAEAAAPGRLVPDLVAGQAAARPDATAVVCGQVRLTYRELLARADRLAARLAAAGVGPDVPVGLLLPRSAELAVAVLGVLRAGGAYVPLDPGDPPARLAYQISEAGVRQLLATAATTEPAAGLGVPVLQVDAAEPDGPVDLPARSPARPGNLAYVLYTSGSTGTPKGVAVEHRALTNLAVAVGPGFGMAPGDRVLQFVSFTFDVAVADVVHSLVAGAELHIAQDHERLGDALFTRLDQAAITHAFLPPAAAMTLPRPDALGALRTFTLGGEAVPAELVRRLAAPHRRVINAYGPAECTVLSTLADLHPEAPVVIGRPVPGARAYVLDQRLRVVPTGATGELYLAGALLARGYAGRPDLTAERFVADPYGPPGSRMYRTGDLARYDAGVTLHYLGRADTQVKVRGFRIELGEVEALLAAHPGVAVAAAAAHGTGVDRRLVAYVVGVDGRRPSDSSLRAHLADRLPGYLVPEVFVHLDQLPVNRSGKIDRGRLPDPPPTRPDLAESYVPAGTATQQRVAKVWADVLGHDQLGVHDNFFELGGNSIRLLIVRSALHEIAGAELELADLFRYPTIASLAAHLNRIAALSNADGDPGTDDAGERGSDRRSRLAAAAHRRRPQKGSS